MQEFFTQATIAVELLGAGYIASSFAVYAHRRMNQPVRWEAHRAAIATAPVSSKVLLPEISASSRVPVPEPPASKKQTPPKPKLPKPKLPSVEQLRRECQQARIKWRNAHGKNKHLKQAEMIAALQQLGNSKPVEPAKVLEPSKPVTSQPKPVVATHQKAA